MSAVTAGETIVGSRPNLTVSPVDGRYTSLYVSVTGSLATVHVPVCWSVLDLWHVPGMRKTEASGGPVGVTSSSAAVSPTSPGLAECPTLFGLT